MLEYEFETVSGKGVFVAKTQEHREIIRQRAARGWRYAGWIPSKQSGEGLVMEIDLIFAREQGGQA